MKEDKIVLGRPVDKNSMHQTGHKLFIWMTKEMFEGIDKMAKAEKVSKAEVIRGMLKLMMK